ncbi:hypothetical protein [Amycolatopsis sp. NPDC051903]|uniref:hypothetical protein n=1 Tax=Amycolatopsis sp. NPDC051903 TaxID=3363936 RepID=UPI0037BDB59A
MSNHHHVSNKYCGQCDRWHCQCDGCGWFWYNACTFGEALRHIRLHQLDKVCAEAVAGPRRAA